MSKRGVTKERILDIIRDGKKVTLTDIKDELNKRYGIDLNKSTLVKHIDHLDVDKKKDDHYGKLVFYELKNQKRKEDKDNKYNIPSITIRIDDDNK